ncbi:DNA primase [Candidatus Gottesmanbacteria bacterium RIFCSPHIGHO2_01_FULL_39_10]|uniref:DNA primase n=1 Tax=Candidatus Gottesmanbacteria bacterium RIFCSPHIGHO2_01_FULL_39_10 TaxID=1798375 RepID=A0A1F5ZMD6_9BACT|nr:MAG: DNA primase [Candidatus Gottesmanbacteria bacterium RIFCSPHIGHO2_01_FULL_39_10]
MNDLEVIKSKIDIVSFLGEYIELKKAGRNFKALCPFHSEKTPSFVVSPERGTWHCFGACNMGGDIFEFLCKWENIEFVEALKILAQKAGITLSSYQPTEGLKIKERLYDLNHLASEYYHYILTSHSLGKKAHEYLKDRGLNDKIIKNFTLGYAPNSWDALIRFLKKKKYSQDEMITAGLVIKTDRGTIYDRFRGRLMFTLRDHRGNIIGFSGRVLDAKVSSEANQGAKYINTPETPIYIKGNALYGLDKTAESIRREKEAVIVEGEFDFLSSYQSGVTNIVAIKGSAFTEGQINLLKRYTENLKLALDSDFAGLEAAKKGITAAENAGLNLEVVTLPIGKDPDECIRKDPSLWKKAVKNTVNIYDFLISNAMQKYDKETVSGKKNIGSYVIPFLSRIGNPIVLSHYIKLLSKNLDVSYESIELILEKEKKGIKEKPLPSSPVTTTPDRTQLLEEHLLSLLLHSTKPKETLEKTIKLLNISDLKLPTIGKIFEILKNYFQKNQDLNIKLISKLLTPEISPTFDKAYLQDIDFLTKDEASFTRDLEKTAASIRIFSLRRTINSLTTNLKKKDSTKEEKEAQNNIKNFLSQIHDLEKRYL